MHRKYRYFASMHRHLSTRLLVTCIGTSMVCINSHHIASKRLGKMVARRSIVWRFFKKENEKNVRCNLCKKIIKSAGNTSNMMGHIRNVHKATFMTMWKNEELKKTAAINIAEATEEHEIPQPENEAVPVSLTPTPIAAPQSQQSIVSSFEKAYSLCNMKADKINKALVYMICKDSQPFSIVENCGFTHFAQTVAPCYKLPCQKTLKSWVDAKYEELFQIVRSKLELVEYVTLTTDIWSESMYMKSFLGVTVHFGVDVEFLSVTLGVYELDEGHTSEYISQKLIDTCTEWNIGFEKVSAVITDNTANMVKAVGLSFGKAKHIPCFAHVLNLMAQATIDCGPAKEIIIKIKEIVRFFKQNCAASDELRKATIAETKLIQDDPTHWNSTFYMVERFLTLKSVVSDILLHHYNAPSMLRESEISAASCMIQLLRPLEAASKELSGDRYCTASKIIPLVSCMTRKIKSLSLTDPMVKTMHQQLLKELNKRMGSLEMVTPLAIATLLDPRFKKLHFVDNIACSSAVQKIKEIMSENRSENISDSDSSVSDKSENSFSLWSDHQTLVHRSWKSNKTNEDVSDELSVYLKSPVSRLNENPLEIWSDFKVQFPKLYHVAFKYLTLAGSSIPAERQFSKACQIINQQRNQLDGKRLQKLLFFQSVDKKFWEI